MMPLENYVANSFFSNATFQEGGVVINDELVMPAQSVNKDSQSRGFFAAFLALCQR